MTTAHSAIPTQTPQGSLIHALADFSVGLSLDAVPPLVRRQASLTVLDTVGSMVAALDEPDAQALVRHERRQHVRAGAASVVGLEELLDPQAAARCNGYLGDIFELNDLTGGHAGIGVVPAALAVAEAQGRGGRELLEAVIAGIEVTSRVYAAYYPSMKSYQETGIAPPGIPSTLGAAAAVARLLGLDRERTASALSIAAALAGWCPAEVIFGQGGAVKPMLFGSWPGSVGVQAAQYAQAGLDGPMRILESSIGLYATLARSFDAREIMAATRWHLAEPRRKQHACCGYIHSALDGVIELRKGGAPLSQASIIEIGMPAYIIPGVSKSGAPRAANEARFHAEYCIAVAIAGADVIQPQHSVRWSEHLPRVQSVLERIRLVSDPGLSHYHQSVVRGLDDAGREVFRHHTIAPRGAPRNPMPDADVERKFASLCGDRLSSEALREYITDFRRLDQAKTVDWIVRRFTSAAQA